jgi:deoxyhypusine synthase
VESNAVGNTDEHGSADFLQSNGSADRIDFRKVKLHPIRQRTHKVSLKDFLNPQSKQERDLLADYRNESLDELAQSIVEAHRNKKKTITMLGAHVIKCGLSRYIIHLMERGIITHVALNGAGAIHDFEVALIGATSEYVEKNLVDGSFGMARETGEINEIVRRTDGGFGESVGRYVQDNLEFKKFSILANAYRLGIPVTVHVAIGTDIIHQHPNFDGASTGRASYRDFKILVSSVAELEKGVVLNIGSAVILPEVFLKALSVAKNLGYSVSRFTAANLDMIDHYRPRVNVVERPTSQGGRGFVILGRHEKTIPYLYQQIVKTLTS